MQLMMSDEIHTQWWTRHFLILRLPQNHHFGFFPRVALVSGSWWPSSWEGWNTSRGCGWSLHWGWWLSPQRWWAPRFHCRLGGMAEAWACSPSESPQTSPSVAADRAPLTAGRTVGGWAWTSSSCHLESCHLLRGRRGVGWEEAGAGIRQGQRAGRACAAWGLSRAPRRRGAGWDTSPPPAILNKASESVAPATAPRSQSCGGETASEASSAAFRPSPASRPACAWGRAGRAGQMMAGVLRCCWIAASDSYVYVTTETTLMRYFLFYKQKSHVYASFNLPWAVAMRPVSGLHKIPKSSLVGLILTGAIGQGCKLPPIKKGTFTFQSAWRHFFDWQC